MNKQHLIYGGAAVGIVIVLYFLWEAGQGVQQGVSNSINNVLTTLGITGGVLGVLWLAGNFVFPGL